MEKNINDKLVWERSWRGKKLRTVQYYVTLPLLALGLLMLFPIALLYGAILRMARIIKRRRSPKAPPSILTP